MKAIVFAIALLLPSTVFASDGDASLPQRFTGTWAGSPTSCGSDADDLALRLTPRRIIYWESDGPIRSVVVRGDEVALIGELSGEGETWLSIAKFELSRDGRMLIDSTSIPGKEIVRYRCRVPIDARPDDSFKPMPPRGPA